MPTVVAKSTAENRLIVVLPRIRLSGTANGQDRFAVSKATFLPDAPESWTESIQLPRPEWLDIYRQFPEPGLPPEPARGTLIISDDEDWLRTHISRLIAVVYILGLRESHWRTPADTFQYSAFEATVHNHDTVSLITKSARNIEDLRSLQLLPPLELRAVSRLYRVNLRDEKCAELVRRFDANPNDRLAVACYHLFRSQFDNVFVAPINQDFSALCACLEASLDVEGPNYAKELSEKLAGMYGKHETMQWWIKGLYSERSVFNHGCATEPTLDSPDERDRALAAFRQKPLSRKVLRDLCLDVINERLQDSLDSVNRERVRQWNPIRQLLRKFFHSEEIWGEIARMFTQSKSVDKIQAFTGSDRESFIELCCSFLNGHDWEAMTSKASSKTVCKVLKVMAALVGEAGKTSQNDDDIVAAQELFSAAESEDRSAIVRWVRNHRLWEKLPVNDIGDAAKAAAFHTALFFQRPE